MAKNKRVNKQDTINVNKKLDEEFYEDEGYNSSPASYLNNNIAAVDVTEKKDRKS
ncbi:hypothetical protein [Aquibacillus albus]|uniref:YfhD family protein n=1 Tax=Aquibacillus albus TaxID=1168171 RepID=A0ABS2N076_9BACI|nr:hypothetical protein [Aquibacillus albus]MBM7571512.1 hypothetical protein [Aquibacillus albus]